MSKNKGFFDDPLARITDWLFHLEQNQMRSAISAKYKQKLLEQTYWLSGTTNENEGLSDNEDERQVQRLMLSQVSTLLAHRVFSKRNWFIVPLVFLVIMGLSIATVFAPSQSASYLLSSILAFIGFFLFFGTDFLAPVFAWLILPSTAIRQDEIDEIKATINRCVIRDIPDDTPADLIDRKRILTVDAKGEAVAGQILSSDLEFSALRSEWMKTKQIFRFFGATALTPLLLAINPLLLIPFYLFLVHSVVSALKAVEGLDPDNPVQASSGSNPMLNILYIIVPVIFGVLSLMNFITPSISAFIVFGFNVFGLTATYSYKSPLSVRALLLQNAVTQSGTELLIDKAGKSYFTAQEDAKNAQIDNARKDKTPFISIGKSTGIFAERRDYSAPTEKGLTMGLTVKDISTHLFALGASGTGKTYGVIRPIAKAWADMKQGGMIVLDGKGVLPQEIAEYCESDFTLISPIHTPKYNPLLGMTPDSFADTIADVCSGKDADPFWQQSGRLMVRMAANAIAMQFKQLSFSGVYDFLVMDESKRIEILNGFTPSNVVQQNVVSYFTNELPKMDEKTRENILQNVRSWLGNVINSAELSDWCNTEQNPVNVEEVFTGARIGVLLPESLYGEGAKVISALVMRRIYDAAKKRGDRWAQTDGQTSVMMVADEIQNLLSSADIENAAIARSLGLYLVMASQNVDGLYKRLGEDGAVQMLGNFASLIALPPKTQDSNAFLSMRSGNIWRSTVSMYFGLPDAQSDVNLFNNSGTDRQMQNIGLYRRARASRPRLAYALGLSGHNLIDAQKRTLEDLVMDKEMQPQQSANLTLDVAPIVKADEVESLLAKPHTAIAIFNRAGVVRRDVIDLGV